MDVKIVELFRYTKTDTSMRTQPNPREETAGGAPPPPPFPPHNKSHPTPVRGEIAEMKQQIEQNQ